LLSPQVIDLDDEDLIGETGLQDGDVITAIVPQSRESWIEWRTNRELKYIEQANTSPRKITNKINQRIFPVVDSAEKLEIFVRVCYHKALEDPSHSRAIPVIMGMLYHLLPVIPDFGGKPMTRALLHVCQNEFETSVRNLKELELLSSEEADMCMNKYLANLNLIGNLFLQKLVGVKVIGQIVHVLVGIRGEAIRDYHVQGTCDLLELIGTQMKERHSPHGALLLAQFLRRLRDLEQSDAFSHSIKSRIENVVTLCETS